MGGMYLQQYQYKTLSQRRYVQSDGGVGTGDPKYVQNGETKEVERKVSRSKFSTSFKGVLKLTHQVPVYNYRKPKVKLDVVNLGTVTASSRCPPGSDLLSVVGCKGVFFKTMSFI